MVALPLTTMGTDEGVVRRANFTFLYLFFFFFFLFFGLVFDVKLYVATTWLVHADCRHTYVGVDLFIFLNVRHCCGCWCRRWS